jgi:hypothetical protein
MAWWGWLLVGWTVLALVAAPLVGIALREADALDQARLGAAPPLAQRVRRRRRRIPVPPVARGLIAVGVSLEAIGFALRATGHEQGGLNALSMDHPLSVPRMFVTGVFAAAALAAFLGTTRTGSRRGWWLAVGTVATVVAEVKGGGTVHIRALEAAGVADRPVVAALGSALLAGFVLTGLFWLSRHERRDRRRVLTAFGVYVAASVGLSAVSSLAGEAFGGVWSAAATFLEESGEVVGAVAVLTAVLVGVAPRLVLPADWAIRRAADAETVDAPSTLPAWRTRGYMGA